MRILVISPHYYPEPFRINEICEELVKNGNVVKVITDIPNYPSGKFYNGYDKKTICEVINGVSVTRVRHRPRNNGSFNLFLNYYSFSSSLLAHVKKIINDFDIVFVYQLSPIMYLESAVYLKKKYNIPIVCYSLDLWPESLKVRKIGKIKPIFNHYFKLSKRLYNECDKIIVSSPSFVEYFRNVIGFKPDIECVYQHYNKHCDIYSSNKSEKIKLIYAGNVGHAQKLQFFISVISKKTNFHFDVYGSGSCLTDCRKYVEHNQIKNVEFHGLVGKEELYKAYSNSNICVVSLVDDSRIGNTIPAKIQEYMCLGKPILGVIKGDAKKIIEEANCGFVSNPYDEEGLLKNLEYIEDNFDRLKEIGCNGEIFFKQNFTLDIYVNKILKILEEECKNV